MRRALFLALAAAALAVAAATALPAGAAPATSCRTAEVQVHDEAVFGHFATVGPANALKKKAAKLGFQGIKIENDGCGDYEVEIDGADTSPVRSSFAAEAQKAGFPVTFEQTAPPLDRKPAIDVRSLRHVQEHRRRQHARVAARRGQLPLHRHRVPERKMARRHAGRPAQGGAVDRRGSAQGGLPHRVPGLNRLPWPADRVDLCLWIRACAWIREVPVHLLARSRRSASASSCCVWRPTTARRRRCALRAPAARR